MAHLCPAPSGIHPTDGDVHHELYLMCDDVRATAEGLSAKGVQLAGEIRDEGFGLVASIAVPGAGEIALYEPRHPTALALGREPGGATSQPGPAGFHSGSSTRTAVDVAPDHAPAPWHVFEQAEPELAAAVRNRFEANLHHVLGTIRPDGSPRLSGTEVRIEHGEVTIGMMPGSQKLGDVLRDPRVELHSAPLEAELTAGDAKLAGSLVEHGPTHETSGTSYRLRIALASLVRVEADQLLFTTWRPGRGVREIRRS